MKTKLPLRLFFVIFICNNAFAQLWMQAPYLKAKPDSSGNYNFYDIQKAFESFERKYERKKERDGDAGEEDEGKFPGYMQYKRWEAYMAPRVYPSGDITLPSTRQQEFQKYLSSSNYRHSNPNSHTLGGNWVSLGPTGTHWGGYFGGAARVSFLRFHPTNSDIMWTFAPSGGLWKTTDGGLNWATNTDQLPMIGCTDIAINPLNPQFMYMATGDGNGNGSQLWQASTGILKSTDGGLTWPLASNTMNWQVSWGRCIYKLLINPVDTNIIFAATSAGLYRTLNSGGLWTSVVGGPFTDVEFKPGNPNIVYATSGIANTGTFYKSINGGSTFVTGAPGLPLSANVARLDIAVTPADTNIVYLVAVKTVTKDFYGFYRSVDGGNNFTLQANAPNILAGIPASQAHYNLAIAVSAIHKDTIIVGGTESWRSTDGGVTWIKHTSTTGAFAPFVHPDMHDIEYLPGSDSIYFSCNDGGVWKTTDYGATWNPMNEGLQIAQMYRLGTSRINPYTIVTGHQDMATHRLITNSWDIITPNTGDGMECILEYDNDTVIYLESYNGRIIKAFNTIPLFNIVCTFSGVGVNSAGNWITPVVMHPVFDTILLVGKLQIYRTSDGGASFLQVGNIPGVGGNMVALAYAPSNPNFIYAAKANHFFVTTDGNNFTERSAGLPVPASQITAIAVSSTQPEKVWVTFSGYNAANKVWTSSDTGLTWSNYSTGLPNLPVNCIVYQNNTNNALYVGTDVGVYFIADSLASWQTFNNGLPNVEVQELELAYGVNKIRAATSGRGLWESDFGIITSTPLPVDILSFTGHYDDAISRNELEWVTSSERNCNYFEIMKSSDANYFASIGNVDGAGNSNQQRNYYFDDENAVTGIHYYYLRQFDFDGNISLSNTISIRAEKGRQISIFPNPAEDKIRFRFLRHEEIYDLQLFDMVGKEIPLYPLRQLSSDADDALDISNITAGLYYLKLTNFFTGEFYYGKFVKK
ncbi:MAG: T9SS type A sorting domain-containing protein [Bacteroidota bacterium]